MPAVLTLDWWALALRGFVAILFGLFAFFIPLATLFALTLLFGAFALLDGILSLVAAVRSNRHGENWWALLIEGVAGICAAAAAFIWPVVTLVVLIYIVAAWAIITGIFEIIAVIRLRRYIANEWLLTLAGIASIVFGVLLLGAPGAGAIVLALYIGAYAFIFGVLLLTLAFRLRRLSSGSMHLRHA